MVTIFLIQHRLIFEITVGLSMVAEVTVNKSVKKGVKGSGSNSGSHLPIWHLNTTTAAAGLSTWAA
jgi:hypothetical protein